MATAALQFFKETALPASISQNSVYFVAPPTDPNHVEVYVSNSDGTIVRRVINSADVQAMISTAIAAANTLTVVADIAARDALSPTASMFAFVVNATGDSTVLSGGATYLWNQSTTAWIKISEAESMDVTTTWASIQNKPTSSVASIDSAVANSHTHINSTQLAKIGENASGKLTYDGDAVVSWENAAW